MPMKFVLTLLPALIPFLAFSDVVDYKTNVLPIMKERCWSCHSNEKEVKGNLALDDFEEVRDYQIGKYNIIRPGNAEESNFVERLLLASDHTDFMPRKGDPLSKKEIDTIKEWIQLGAVVDAEKPSDEEKERLASTSMKSKEKEEKGEFLSWTNSAGKAIEARFLGLEGEKVQLLLKNGKQYAVSLDSLSDASAEQARLSAERIEQ